MQIKAILAEMQSRPSTLPALPTTAATAAVAQAIPAIVVEVNAQWPPDLDEPSPSPEGGHY